MTPKARVQVVQGFGLGRHRRPRRELREGLLLFPEFAVSAREMLFGHVERGLRALAPLREIRGEKHDVPENPEPAEHFFSLGEARQDARQPFEA